jgi:polyphenol oxidase
LTTTATYAEKSIRDSALRPLRSEALSRFENLTHGFTRRVPGVGLADANISYTAPRDREEAWRMRRRWCAELGIDAEDLVVPHQVHGATVGIATRSDLGRGAAPGSALFGQFDALVTNEPGVPLMTTHADCLPVVLFAPEDRVAATVHAGWRSTIADVVGETVRAVEMEFGVDPSNIVATLGPSICKECYEIGAEVATLWDRVDPGNVAGAVGVASENLSFDLANANHWLLQRAGLRDRNIERSPWCTRCNGDEWFSHRGQGPATGRFASIVALHDRT